MSLSDLIKELRQNRDAEEAVLQKALQRINAQVAGDAASKAQAVLKLTYLQMLGFNAAWAAFHIVTVMSSTRFHEKRIGYFAALQTFNEDTEVLVLMPNQLKKVKGWEAR